VSLWLCDCLAYLFDDAPVRAVSQAALVGWGEAFVKLAGTDILSCLAARCRSLAATEGQAGAGAGVRVAGRGSSDGHASSSSQEDRDMLKQGGSSSAELNSSSSLGGWSPPPADIPFSVLRAATHSAEQQHAAAPGEAMQRLATRLAAGSKAAATCSDSWTADGAAVVQHQLIRSGVSSHESQNRRHDEGLHGVVHPETLPTPSPQVQTRQDVWAQAQVPSPAELRELKCQLAKLLIAVDYQTGSSLQVLSEFKDFG